jgi:hypothetical protein
MCREGRVQVYEEALQSEHCEAVHLTRVLRDDIECDTFLPALDPKVPVHTPPQAHGRQLKRAGVARRLQESHQ